MSKRSDPAAFARATGAADPPGLTGLPQPEPPPADAPPMIVEEEPYSATPHIDANGFDPADYRWVPVRRRPRADGWSEAKQRAFIEVLADTGQVDLAANEVGMSVQSAYALRRSPGGEAFAGAWAAAIQQASFKLVEIAFDRAINGSDRVAFDELGNRIRLRRKASDQMLMFLLRAHQPERYRHAHQSVRHASEPPPPPTVPIAQALATLEPVAPPEPHALMPPDELDLEVQVADMLDGETARWYRHTTPEEKGEDEFPLGEAFERRLEAAKAAGRHAARHGDDAYDDGEAYDDEDDWSG